jgi:hypothetical protein
VWAKDTPTHAGTMSAGKRDLHQGWKWRLRASQLRTHAESVRDAEARATLLMLAQEWELRARRAEQQPKSPNEANDSDRPRRR